MQSGELFSVRMRAAKDGPHERGGTHISGGEMLAAFGDIQQAVMYLLEKGLNHSKGRPDFMQIQFECIHEPAKCVKPLKMKTNEVETPEEGQALAWSLLEETGIRRRIIDEAYKLVSQYSSMSGAVLIDVHSGMRLDNRKEKGVRVSRMDWQSGHDEKWAGCHDMPLHSRVREAVVLATKVCGHRAAVAELCWSDDPDYITGYVASKRLGYQRITKLKEYGDERGCRIFFVDGKEDIHSYIHYLENQPVIVQWEVEE